MISGANADKWIFCTNYQLAIAAGLAFACFANELTIAFLLHLLFHLSCTRLTMDVGCH